MKQIQHGTQQNPTTIQHVGIVFDLVGFCWISKVERRTNFYTPFQSSRVLKSDASTCDNGWNSLRSGHLYETSATPTATISTKCDGTMHCFRTSCKCLFMRDCGLMSKAPLRNGPEPKKRSCVHAQRVENTSKLWKFAT